MPQPPTQCVHVCVTLIHTHIYGHSLLPSKISERCKYSSLQLQFSHRKLSPYFWIVFPRPGDKPHIPGIRLCQDAEPQGALPQPHRSAIGLSLSPPPCVTEKHQGPPPLASAVLA